MSNGKKNLFYLSLAVLALVLAVAFLIRHEGEIGIPKSCEETRFNVHCFCGETEEKVGVYNPETKKIIWKCVGG